MAGTAGPLNRSEGSHLCMMAFRLIEDSLCCEERKEELPAAPQIFLADFSLLFHQDQSYLSFNEPISTEPAKPCKDPDVKLPWIHRVKCELPRRVGRLSGDLPVRASYIGKASYHCKE